MNNSAIRRVRSNTHVASRRRGVASVLAMMFLVIFGSLAAAMAVVAQGNLRTADSGLKLSRAMSAAETGMTFAMKRLQAESSRFVVEKGVIDATFGEGIWKGTYDEGTDGDVDVLPPEGYTTTAPPAGVAYALRDAHEADAHTIIINPADEALPAVDNDGTLRCKPIALSDGTNAPYFRLTYQLIEGTPYVRVISEGVDGDITRTLQMDFKIDKKIEFAILSPNRIMIGKNVLVEGPLGSRYGLVAGELDPANGDPLVMRSDFYYLDDDLNAKLDILFQQVIDYDDDGDSRIRPDHPNEDDALAGHPELVDYNGDEYVDDYDLFMAHFDADSDGKIQLDTEFIDIDDQLARLIDTADPDRDDDGEITESDTGLGYDDGVLDVNDLYAKVRGKLRFAVTRDAWEIPHGASYQTVVSGPVVAELDVAPTAFEVSEDDMREITTAMFDDSQTYFDTAAAGDFTDQLTGGTVVPASETTVDPNDDTWEPIPYGAFGAYDYYNRTIYRDFTFTNVRIPKGTNALFENCTFVGVTFVEINEECADVNWNFAGAVEKKDEAGVITYPIRFPTITAESGGVPIADTRVESNNIRFENCTFLGSVAGHRPNEYTHWRNKLQFTGNTRFYIDVSDEDLADQPDASTLTSLLNSMSSAEIEEMQKSSILMPGWSVDVGNFSNEVDPDPDATAKVKLKGTIIAGIMDVRGTADVHGTLLMTFRPQLENGPLYYGGLTDAFNTTIGYFGPLDGDGEGVDQADATFTGFGEITLRYDPDAKLPDGIPWPICIDPEPETYTE